MSNPKLISSFDQFERIYESVERGDVPMNEGEINEGIFSGIMNFFSRVFGGRVTEIDRILNKYKKNETDYWTRWAEANHEYNKAAAKRDTSEDEIDRRKNLEMMERASSLIKQVNRTRMEVNNALERQAMLRIRGNNRLRRYWDLKKAKADEDIANSSYTSLKKTVDEDTLDELYDRVRETQAKAKEKIKKMPKGSMTIEFGQYKDMSDYTEEQSFDNFGVHDLDDFVFSDDKLWNERIKLMPKANLDKIAKHIDAVMISIKSDTDKEVKKIKEKAQAAEGDKKKQLEDEIAATEKTAADDLTILSARLEQISGPKKEEPKKEEQPKEEPKEEPAEDAVDVKALRTKFETLLDSKKDKIKINTGDVTDKELGHIMADLMSIYDMLPVEDKDEDKEEDIRMVQLVDFATDVAKYRKDNKLTGPANAVQSKEIFANFKKEFPK